MLRKLILSVLSLTFAVPVLALDHQFTRGQIIDVQHKVRQKTEMYLVNTPITTDVPYFEIEIRLDQTDYIAEYNPRHPKEELPESWVAGAEIQVRAEKHHLFLKRPHGSEIQWIINKRIHVKNS